MESPNVEKKVHSNAKIISILKNTGSHPISKKTVTFALLPEEKIIKKEMWENDKNIDYIFEPDHDSLVEKRQCEVRLKAANTMQYLFAKLNQIQNPFFFIYLSAFEMDEEIFPVLSIHFKQHSKSIEERIKKIATEYGIHIFVNHTALHHLKFIYDEENKSGFEKLFKDLSLIKNNDVLPERATVSSHDWITKNISYALGYFYEYIGYFSQLIYNEKEDCPMVDCKTLKL